MLRFHSVPVISLRDLLFNNIKVTCCQILSALGFVLHVVDSASWLAQLVIKQKPLELRVELVSFVVFQFSGCRAITCQGEPVQNRKFAAILHPIVLVQVLTFGMKVFSAV